MGPAGEVRPVAVSAGRAAARRCAYLPFGMGPRVCIGAQFALTEATLVLAAMIQAFQIERAYSEPVDAGRDRHHPARSPAALPTLPAAVIRS